MPARMPKSFKGYPPGANPKSFRGVRRPAPPSQPTYMGGIGLGGTNLLKTRVIQSGLYHMCSGGLLLIMAIVADSQYGFARRFSKEIVGAGLLTVTFLKAGLELFLSLYVLVIWYLSLILDVCFFNLYALVSLFEAMSSFWAVVCVIASLAYTDGGSGIAYSSGQRTMLIFLSFVLCVSCLLSLAFLAGTVRLFKDQKYRMNHSSANFSSVVVAHHKAPAADEDDDDDDDDDDSSDDDEDVERGPARPAAPQRSVALPTPGAAGAQPQFYQTSTVPAQPASTAVSSAGSSATPVDKPVHDETTRALFAHMWQSMKEVGNFSCGVSRVPGLPELVEHLRKHGFLPLMTGDNGSERKLYFYAEEIVDGTRVMVFLAEFKFAVATKKLDATFKSHTKTHIQQVRKFNLQELFQVVKV